MFCEISSKKDGCRTRQKRYVCVTFGKWEQKELHKISLEQTPKCSGECGWEQKDSKKTRDVRNVISNLSSPRLHTFGLRWRYREGLIWSPLAVMAAPDYTANKRASAGTLYKCVCADLVSARVRAARLIEQKRTGSTWSIPWGKFTCYSRQGTKPIR